MGPVLICCPLIRVLTSSYFWRSKEAQESWLTLHWNYLPYRGRWEEVTATA